jgi:hypothetical protein
MNGTIHPFSDPSPGKSTVSSTNHLDNPSFQRRLDCTIHPVSDLSHGQSTLSRSHQPENKLIH